MKTNLGINGGEYKVKGPLGLMITKTTEAYDNQQFVITRLTDYKEILKNELLSSTRNNRNKPQIDYLQTCYYGVEAILNSYKKQFDNEEFDTVADFYLKKIQLKLPLKCDMFDGIIAKTFKGEIPEANDNKSDYKWLNAATNQLETYYENANQNFKETGKLPASYSQFATPIQDSRLMPEHERV